MLVFSTARLVFLSVPKTGTTAYEAALAPLAAMIVLAPPELKHAPMFRYNRFYRPALEKFVSDKLDILAVMREPVSWLGSWYRYRQRDELDGQRVSTKGVSFDEFVTDYLKGQQPPHANVGSQVKFLEPQANGTRVTHLFRYEDQDGLRRFLEERLDTKIETTRQNSSPDMALELSEKTLARFRRKRPDEFALWNGIGSNGAYTPLP
ncbi:gamma-glutamyl kinase [Roseovarius faecimaris]|uniref:Gamma-glutamyl kinase n=1 Tax=Roseovarius faecimaris TaxID=2494550 RepID=A0A6I6ISV4_9RHOB|nr:gamma-glutamyl kinase [Roseovarius faecimaris]QGX98597.1 gamma-glutamyl kinase [Roseovarius faecimaris]